MMPFNPNYSNHSTDIPNEAIEASVLLLLKNIYEEPSILLTLRSEKLTNHKGQISFPGGKIDQGENDAEAALRECWEEVGIEQNKIELIGELSPFYLKHTNMKIQPVLGYLKLNEEITFKLNEFEVQEAFWISLEDLIHNENKTEELWKLKNDFTFKVPFWNVHDTPLWGATAMMLSELLELYEDWKSA